jgi:prepilin-type N-terminal cleavage/methylation domain-containing protein
MKQDGFSLIEMLIVMFLIGILLTLGTLSFSAWNTKNKIETQFRTMYADLMGARSQALYRKRGQSVRITATGFSVYSSIILTTSSIAPIRQKALRVAVTTNPANLQLDFVQTGTVSIYQTGVSPQIDNYSSSICVQSNSSKAVNNSIILKSTRLQMGSLSGTGCSSANITPQ